MCRSWVRARTRRGSASTVFDGARAFEGVAPDLELHCARVNQSAINFKLKPRVSSRNLDRVGARGHCSVSIAKAELYIRPMYWAETGSGGGVLYDPEIDALVPVHLRSADAAAVGPAITLSPFRRPTMENAPVDCQGRLSLSQ